MNIKVTPERVKGVRQVRLNVDHAGTQGIVLIAEDGWAFTNREKPEGYERSWGISGATKGQNVRFSLNSPLRMTIEEFHELFRTISKEWIKLTSGQYDATI